MKKIIFYANQFFGGVGGEISADTVRRTRREFPVFDDVRLIGSVF